MKWQRLALILVVSSSLACPAFAGIFSRKPKPSPQRAQDLVTIVKSDADDAKRASAAEELQQYDPKNYPEVVPALIAALHDSKPEVRAAAVGSLGKLRPVSQEVGAALEQVRANDSSIKVRIQARTTLWQYYLAGYWKGDAAPAGTVTTQEPPLADPAIPGSQPPPAASKPQPASRFRPVAPASADMPKAPAPSSPARPAPAPRPMPAPAPVLETPPPAAPGPELNAPK